MGLGIICSGQFCAEAALCIEQLASQLRRFGAVPEKPRPRLRSTPRPAADMLAAAGGSVRARGRDGILIEFREFEDGELIAGTRYRVLRLIGVGGMGSVYEVEHVELGKRFVLKALLRELARRDDLVARLRNEWRALARLQHENIVNVTDAGISGGGVPFYVMELLDGETLGARLKQKRRLHVIEAVMTAAHVLKALNAAHDIGVIHRDVKPANIFLVTGGGVKLLDFGVAKIADATGVVTQRGIAVGTPRYMSPEQARGERVDGRSDIYATGLILFEMITGMGPYDDARDANELVLAQLARPAPALSSVIRGVAPEIERILARMLAKDCRERPSHARSVAEQLQSFVVRYRQSPSTSAPTLTANYAPGALSALQAQAEGKARRSAPTLGYADTSLEAEAADSVTTGGARTVSGEGTSQEAVRNTTYISAPSFEVSTTLEMATLASNAPCLGPPNAERAERAERTEILGEFEVAMPLDAVVTRTSVPLIDVGRPISMTPPPVVQVGDFAPPASRSPRLGRAAAFGAAGVALLAVTVLAARRVPSAQPSAGAPTLLTLDRAPSEPRPAEGEGVAGAPTLPAPRPTKPPSATHTDPAGDPVPPSANSELAPVPTSRTVAAAPAVTQRQYGAKPSDSSAPARSLQSRGVPRQAAPRQINRTDKPASVGLPASGL
jgi:serine/threonine protein kinase